MFIFNMLALLLLAQREIFNADKLDIGKENMQGRASNALLDFLSSTTDYNGKKITIKELITSNNKLEEDKIEIFSKLSEKFVDNLGDDLPQETARTLIFYEGEEKVFIHQKKRIFTSSSVGPGTMTTSTAKLRCESPNMKQLITEFPVKENKKIYLCVGI